MGIQLAVEQEHLVAFGLGGLYPLVLGHCVCSIQIYDFLVLVFLFFLNEFAEVFVAEEFAVCCLEQGKLHGSFAELLVGEHTIFDE